MGGLIFLRVKLYSYSGTFYKGSGLLSLVGRLSLSQTFDTPDDTKLSL